MVILITEEITLDNTYVYHLIFKENFPTHFRMYEEDVTQRRYIKLNGIIRIRMAHKCMYVRRVHRDIYVRYANARADTRGI